MTDSAAIPTPERLIVVGAAAGAGRVLCQHVFGRMPWRNVLLIDRPGQAAGLRDAEAAFPGPPVLAVLDGERLRDQQGTSVLAEPGTLVCLAVPQAHLGPVAAALEPRLSPDAVVVETAPMKRAAMDALGPILGARHAFGVRPLFDSLARSLAGQTIVMTHDGAEPSLAAWLRGHVEALGGIVQSTTPDGHDRAMATVQTLTQQTLMAFADAVACSGLDIEDELWAMRTPSFETLLGLAVRTLAEPQQPAVASRQARAEARDVSHRLTEAAAALAAIVGRDDPALTADALARLRDHFSGSLFETIHGTASAVVSATQATRAGLARHRRDATPVGIVTADRPDDLRVGTIVELTPTTVTLDEVLVGTRGDAVLLSGEGLRNARTLGVGGKPRRTAFAMGRIDVLAGAELDAHLDAWLAHIRRDVRFLVPESISGDGVAHVLSQVPRVRDARVVSEVVRTGQRAVVVRVGIRADADVDATVEDLRQRVADAYAWPRGLSLPRRDGHPVMVHYLGPAGTFSETGARHCAAGLGLAGAPLQALGSFEQVLAAVHGGHIGVIPIVSSSSGLVERAAQALVGHGRGIEAGGVADVPVRFDAYVPEGCHLDDLRGADVLSHPQALRQCARFIARWGLNPVETRSTAEAGRLIAGGGTPAVALAGAGLGETFGLRVAEREVDDLSGSLTRFLVLGARGTFGALTGGSDPTLRSLWVAAGREHVADVLAGPGPAFDELIQGRTGMVLLVTSRVDAGPAGDGAVYLGRLPWTPRTPLVRLEA